MHSSTSSSRPARLLNPWFWLTLLCLLGFAEVGLRLIPATSSPKLFRAVYGNSLAMYMRVGERLAEQASELRILAVGDSLTMTQFQPATYAKALGLPDQVVFNSAYLGMSFPSQDRLLRSIGLARLDRLEHVLFFVNPERISQMENPNTKVFRIGVPEPDGPWKEIAKNRKLGALLDHSRLYALSRHILLNSWRTLLWEEPGWDHLEYMQAQGGVYWDGKRATHAAPRLPYAALTEVSTERLAEMERTIQTLRSTGAQVTILTSAAHPQVQLFASESARNTFMDALAQVANRTGSTFIPEERLSYRVRQDTDFCDYAHTNRSGGEAITLYLAQAGLVPPQDGGVAP